MFTKTVLVAEETHDSLTRLKITEREPYGLVVERLVAFYNEHKDTISAIELAMPDAHKNEQIRNEQIINLREEI